MIHCPYFLQNDRPADTRYDQLKQMVLQSIGNKTKCLQIYMKLIDLSPDAFSSSILQRLRSAEEGLLDRFINFHAGIFHTIPKPIITPFSFIAYKDGLILALNLKMDSVAFGRAVLDILEETDLGHALYRHTIFTDMEQENLIAILHAHNARLD